MKQWLGLLAAMMALCWAIAGCAGAENGTKETEAAASPQQSGPKVTVVKPTAPESGFSSPIQPMD